MADNPADPLAPRQHAGQPLAGRWRGDWWRGWGLFRMNRINPLSMIVRRGGDRFPKDEIFVVSIAKLLPAIARRPAHHAVP